MKIVRLLFSISILIAVVSCNRSKTPGVPDNAINPDVMKNPATASSSSNDKTKVPVFQFEEEMHDFGTVTEGEKISYAFKFKNTGTGDLVIRSANASCGCTVPEWPKDPVPPGGNGLIKVTYNSEGKNGMQHKTITLISNTVPNTKVISISVEVEKGEEKK